MNPIKFVQAGDKVHYEAYGEVVARKHNVLNELMFPIRLLTPDLMRELKKRIKNENTL